MQDTHYAFTPPQPVTYSSTSQPSALDLFSVLSEAMGYSWVRQYPELEGLIVARLLALVKEI